MFEVIQRSGEIRLYETPATTQIGTVPIPTSRNSSSGDYD